MFFCLDRISQSMMLLLDPTMLLGLKPVRVRFKAVPSAHSAAYDRVYGQHACDPTPCLSEVHFFSDNCHHDFFLSGVPFLTVAIMNSAFRVFPFLTAATMNSVATLQALFSKRPQLHLAAMLLHCGSTSIDSRYCTRCSFDPRHFLRRWAARGRPFQHFSVCIGTARVFHHGFCCVRVMVIGLRLLHGARFPTEMYTRGCH